MKQRVIVLIFVVLFVPLFTFAGTRNCTSGMVTLGICRATSDVAYCLPISTLDPDGAGAQQSPSSLVADAFASTYNWQTPTACVQEMVTAGICNAGQLGTLVPITKAQFGDLQVRAFVMRTVRQYLRNQQVLAAQAAADQASDPDIGQ
jgi:hypothetical protein